MYKAYLEGIYITLKINIDVLLRVVRNRKSVVEPRSLIAVYIGLPISIVVINILINITLEAILVVALL